MAGYSGTPLVAKLGIKPGCRISLQCAPEGFMNMLEPLPEAVAVLPLSAGSIDVVMLFSSDSCSLKSSFKGAQTAIQASGMVWVAWPKKSARANTDLNENVVRDIGLAAGLVDVKVCAIDDYWSGLKFVWRLKDR